MPSEKPLWCDAYRRVIGGGQIGQVQNERRTIRFGTLGCLRQPLYEHRMSRKDPAAETGVLWDAADDRTGFQENRRKQLDGPDGVRLPGFPHRRFYGKALSLWQANLYQSAKDTDIAAFDHYELAHLACAHAVTVKPSAVA